jgi:hypothetical protein
MRQFSIRNRKLSLALAVLLAALALAGGALRSSGSSEAVSWDDGAFSTSVSWDS